MITNNDIRFYTAAHSVAMNSPCRYKFGAVIVRQGRIISRQSNIIKTHPIMGRYGEWCISIHAEINAILKSRVDVNGAVMYIARDSVNPNSLPCKTCMSIIIEKGIFAIVYHNGTELKKEKL